MSVARKQKLEFDAGELAGLRDHFFEAAALPELWPDVLAKLADAIGAAGCALIGGPDSGFEMVCSPSADEVVDFGRRNGWLSKNIRTPRRLEAFARGHDIVTEATLFTDWELDHLPFHAEYINRFDYRWFADMVIAGDGPSTIVLSAQRQIGTDRFSTSEIEVLRRLVPHVRRAGDLALRFGTARHDGSLEALEQFDCGAFLLDPRGRVIGSNSAAEALLKPGLVLQSGYLTAADKTCDAALQRLIGSVVAPSLPLGSDPPDPVVVAGANGHIRIVFASPLARSARDLFNGAAAILMVSDPVVRSRGHGRLLPLAFGFTNKEASIGAALCAGYDVDDVARTHGADVSTISLHIKSMLEKTGARHQDELVSVIARYVAASK